MTAPLRNTAANAERERRDRGDERAEAGEQDQQDEREPDRLAARELLLRDALEVRPDRRLADHARLCGRRRLHEQAAQVRRLVDRVRLLPV